MYYFWSSGITIRLSLAEFAMLGGAGQGGRLMRIARLETDGRRAGGKDTEVVGCVAVIVAESAKMGLTDGSCSICVRTSAKRSIWPPASHSV